MEVTVISRTVQKFNGESFYLCGYYFQHKGKRLHRTVWEYHNGEIPKGYHVHHIDGDRTHNTIENLTIMRERDHCHGHAIEKADISRETIKKAIVKAPEWHKSEAGRIWHSQRGKKNWTSRTMQTYTCSYCGKAFATKHIYAGGSNHFCHPNCKAAFRRKRLRNGEIVK